jgi:hypothetical protein
MNLQVQQKLQNFVPRCTIFTFSNRYLLGRISFNNMPLSSFLFFWILVLFTRPAVLPFAPLMETNGRVCESCNSVNLRWDVIFSGLPLGFVAYRLFVSFHYLHVVSMYVCLGAWGTSAVKCVPRVAVNWGGGEPCYMSFCMFSLVLFTACLTLCNSSLVMYTSIFCLCLAMMTRLSGSYIVSLFNGVCMVGCCNRFVTAFTSEDITLN